MGKSNLTNEVKTRFQASHDALRTKRQVFDTVEELFHGILNDAHSSKTKSQVFDPRLATLIIERSYRVMAQLPVGKVKGISSNDLGDAYLKNLLLEKYVIPNANAQYDFLTKLRMVDMYSNVYGSFFAMVDWDVKRNGYVGPDMWLLNMRDVFLQVGAVSVDDADHVIIRSWRPLSFFKNLGKKDGFKNVASIITKLQDTSGSKQNRSSEDQSKRGEEMFPADQPAKGSGYFEVLSQFEGDRWVDICVDADLEFRDTKNPHDNGELPIVQKYSLPLLDDQIGIGDMERGASMQKAVNSNWNLYFDGVKMSIMPPVILNKDNIASMSSIKFGAAEKWLGRGAVDNVARVLQLNPQGISTFNNTHQVANAAILNLFGTSDTAVSESIDSSMGKTPQALKMQQARENTRDVADRFYMERFINQVMRKMVNLLEKKQPSDLTVRMFKDEVEDLSRTYPEIAEKYDEKTGKLSVEGGTGKNLYDYEMVSGSTYAVDNKTQQDNLSSLLDLYLKAQTPQGNWLQQKLEEEGFNFKFGELFKRIISNAGTQDWNKILVEMTEQEKTGSALDSDAKVFQNVLTQITQGQNMNAIPAQPDAMAGGMQ